MRGAAGVLRLVAVLAVMLLGVSLAVPVGAQSAVPAAPTGLEATSVVYGSVSLGWDDQGDGSITHYRMLRRDRDAAAAGVFDAISDDTGSAAVSYVDVSVEPEKRYVYRVVAVNAHGESPWSNYVRVNTPAQPDEPEEPDNTEQEDTDNTDNTEQEDTDNTGNTEQEDTDNTDSGEHEDTDSGGNTDNTDSGEHEDTDSGGNTDNTDSGEHEDTDSGGNTDNTDSGEHEDTDSGGNTDNTDSGEHEDTDSGGNTDNTDSGEHEDTDSGGNTGDTDSGGNTGDTDSGGNTGDTGESGDSGDPGGSEVRESSGGELGVLWSGSLVVGDGGTVASIDIGGRRFRESGVVLGYSFAMSDGSLSVKRFEAGGESKTVWYLMLMPSSSKLYLGVDGSLSAEGGLALEVGGDLFSIADAAVFEPGAVSFVYVWDAPGVDWAVGDEFEASLLVPGSGPSALGSLGIDGVGELGFDPGQRRYQTKADPGADTVTVDADSGENTDVEILVVRADGELGFDGTDADTDVPGQQVQLSANGDTLIVAATNDDVSQSVYIVTVSDNDGTQTSGDNDGTQTSGDNDGTQTSGDNDGTQTSGDNDGTQTSGDNDGTQTSGDNDGTQTSGDNDGTQTSGDNDGTQTSGSGIQQVAAKSASVAGRSATPQRVRTVTSANNDADAALGALTITGATLNEPVSADTLDYTADADAATGQITIAVTPRSADATVVINPDDADPDTDGHQINLLAHPPSGDSTQTAITIAIRSQSQSSTEMSAYTLTITRAQAVESIGRRLESITLTGATLDQEFSEWTQRYTATADPGATQITVSAVSVTPGQAIVYIHHIDVDPNTEGHQINLAQPGPNGEPRQTQVIVHTAGGNPNFFWYYTIDIHPHPDPPTPPTAPTGLEARSVAPDSVSLVWDDPSDDTITHYQVLRTDSETDPAGVSPAVLAETDSAAVSYTDASVNPEKHYAYWMVAVNSAGESPRSDHVTVSTPSAADHERSGDDADDASLASLTVSPGLFHYRPGERSHTAYVTPETASVTVAAVAAQPSATVEILPDDSDAVSDGHQVATTGASTAVTVTVASADDTTTETHTITVVHRSGAVKVDVGWDHACALLVSGQVECWGYHGFPGRRDSPASSSPAGDTYVDITAGRFKSCGVRSSGEGYCFDYSTGFGQRETPLPGSASSRLQSVSYYSSGTCWLYTDGSAGCNNWGSPDGLAEGPYRSLDAGYESVCGLGFDNKAHCWGPHGRMDTPDEEFKFLSFGGYNACGIRMDGTLKCWQYDYAPGIAPGLVTYYDILQSPEGTYKYVSVGYVTGCAVTDSGTVGCWDATKSGSGNLRGAETGLLAEADVTFESVAVGWGQTMCGVATDGRVACHGWPSSAILDHPDIPATP